MAAGRRGHPGQNVRHLVAAVVISGSGSVIQGQTVISHALVMKCRHATVLYGDVQVRNISHQ